MMALTAERVSGKIMALFLPIMVFVISGFEHSVANMSYISGGLLIHSQYGSLGLDTAGLTWYNFIVSNLVPLHLEISLVACLLDLCFGLLQEIRIINIAKTSSQRSIPFLRRRN